MNKHLHRIKLCCAGIFLGLVAVLPGEATPVQWPGNGHWYEVVSSPGISWADANAAASAASYLGLEGHLATLTSAAEDAFVETMLGSQHYVGGYQDLGVVTADVGWKWVTGEPWFYTNWGPGEPNDGYGPASEQWLGAGWPGGTWNDEALLSGIFGYVVEYGTIGVPDSGSSLILFGLIMASITGLRACLPTQTQGNG
jgi:hypothetical protein